VVSLGNVGRDTIKLYIFKPVSIPYIRMLQCKTSRHLNYVTSHEISLTAKRLNLTV
jgi:hypothetical protein